MLHYFGGSTWAEDLGGRSRLGIQEGKQWKKRKRKT